MTRVPRSLINEGIPAKDGEFVYADSGLPYSGKYHIISGIAYAGENEKSFPNPIPLDQTPDNQFASLMSTIGYATAAYQMAKQNVELINQTVEKILPSKPIQKSGESQAQRTGSYTFIQKSNDPNKIIKQLLSKETLLIIKFKKDPLYKIVEINFDSPDIVQQLESAEKIIPGITTFVNL